MSILIIDNNKERRQQLALLMDFIDYEIYGSTAVDDWQAARQDDEPEAVLLGDTGDTQATVQLISDIKEIFDTATPILLLSDLHDKSLLPQEISSLIVNIVEQPVKYRQLIHALHLAQVYRESQTNSGNSAPMLFRSLVGHSRSITHVRKLIEQVADTDANVLILGL